jgi:hypothetical protein
VGEIPLNKILLGKLTAILMDWRFYFAASS